MLVLRQVGPGLSRPYADTLKGSRYNNMKELRIQSKGIPIPVFFAFDPGRNGVVLCAGHKAGNEKRFYNLLITLSVVNRRSNGMGRTLEQILATEKPEVVAEAKGMAAEILLNIHLASLRERVCKTQVQMAQALSIKQPTVAGMVKPVLDLKLSTPKRFAEAAAGQLRPAIEFSYGPHI